MPAPERGGAGTAAAVAEGAPGVDVGEGPRSVPPGRGAAGPLPAEPGPAPPGVPPGADGAVRDGTARCTLLPALAEGDPVDAEEPADGVAAAPDAPAEAERADATGDFTDGGAVEPVRTAGAAPPTADGPGTDGPETEGPGTAGPASPAPGTARCTRTGAPLGAEPSWRGTARWSPTGGSAAVRASPGPELPAAGELGTAAGRGPGAGSLPVAGPAPSAPAPRPEARPDA
ncbi:hypothetical protein ACWD3J_40240 [Streptomyces sp. NPDC002755]|uniref:hypothetical protein n=1 Tax=Streptomyces sp. NPDC002884 TaxID=3154544 RepID=UPI0033185BEC